MPTHPGESGLLAKAAHLRQFDLNLLLSLHALLYFRSVTLAGRHLGVTQPAMSGDLRRLRQVFNDPLLVRLGREYELTALAQQLVEPLDELVLGLDRALLSRPCFDPATATRQFSVVMSDYALALLVPRLAERLVEEAPGVSLHFHEVWSHGLAAVARGEMDLMVGADREVDSLHTEALYVDRWVCAVSANHPEVGTSMTAELFQRLPHLELGIGTPPRPNRAEARYQELGVQRWVPITTESFALTPFLLRGTRLVALVPERVARGMQAAAPLKLLEPPFPTPKIVEAMFWSPVTESDPSHAWLRRLIREVARTI